MYFFASRSRQPEIAKTGVNKYISPSSISSCFKMAELIFFAWRFQPKNLEGKKIIQQKLNPLCSSVGILMVQKLQKSDDEKETSPSSNSGFSKVIGLIFISKTSFISNLFVGDFYKKKAPIFFCRSPVIRKIPKNQNIFINDDIYKHISFTLSNPILLQKT